MRVALNASSLASANRGTAKDGPGARLNAWAAVCRFSRKRNFVHRIPNVMHLRGWIGARAHCRVAALERLRHVIAPTRRRVNSGTRLTVANG